MTVEEEREYQRLTRLAFPERHRAEVSAYQRTERGRAVHNAACKRYNGTSKHARTVQRYLRSARGRVTGCVLAARRRALKRAALRGDQKVVEQVYARAGVLRQWFDVVVDHIVPLVKGGAHAPWNLQIIYRRENMEKGARLDYIPTVIFS